MGTPPPAPAAAVVEPALPFALEVGIVAGQDGSQPSLTQGQGAIPGGDRAAIAPFRLVLEAAKSKVLGIAACSEQDFALHYLHRSRTHITWSSRTNTEKGCK
jgi:hypothetical protein